MTNRGGRYLVEPWSPMLAAGRHSDDGSSFVTSETGTEEADNEIRRICLDNNNVRNPTPIAMGEASHDGEEREQNHARPWSATTGQSRAFSDSWNQWASLPTRRKKAAILQYFSFARLFRVVAVTAPDDKTPSKCCLSPKETRITEMQITDCAGCPLFDAWLHRPAWSRSGSRWIVEACGNLILAIQRSESVVRPAKASGSQTSFSSKRLLLPRSPVEHETNKVAWRRWSVTDWNSEHFGYLVASGSGEAVFLETANKETVGKFVRQCTLSRRVLTDSTDLTDDFSDAHPQAVSATPKRRVRRNASGVRRITWTCIHHESGQRLMRLEDDEVACFDAVQGLGLATKLLILAGIVKIVGDLQSTSSSYSCSLFGDCGRSCCK